MAILANYINENGTILPDQYIRIINIDAQKDHMLITIEAYSSEEYRLSGIPAYSARPISAPFDVTEDTGIWQQGYRYLKQIYPEYTDV